MLWNLPISNVIPASLFLVEALHGSHVCRAFLKGQARLAWCVGVMDEQEGQRQGEVGGCSSVRLSAPHTSRNDGWAIYEDIEGIKCLLTAFFSVLEFFQIFQFIGLMLTQVHVNKLFHCLYHHSLQLPLSLHLHLWLSC